MRLASGASTDTDTVRLGLEALVRHASYDRMRALRGSEPKARDVPRRREKSLVEASGLMVLVDTSVWIRFLANRAPFAAQLDALLQRDEVCGHEFVYVELLIGDRGGSTRLLEPYEQMYQAPSIAHREVVAFVRERRLHGRGVG